MEKRTGDATWPRNASPRSSPSQPSSPGWSPQCRSRECRTRSRPPGRTRHAAHTAPGGMKPPHQEPTAQEPRQLAGSDPVRCQIWPPPPPPAPHLAAFAAEPVAAHGVVGQRALLAAVSPALRALLPGQQPAWHVSHLAMPVAPGHGRGEQTLVPTHRQRAAVALLSCLHEAVAALRRVQELPGSRWGEARATGSVPKQGVATSPPPQKKGIASPGEQQDTDTACFLPSSVRVQLCSLPGTPGLVLALLPWTWQGLGETASPKGPSELPQGHRSPGARRVRGGPLPSGVC